MDDCFQERLVYSESDGSEVDEPTGQITETPTTQPSEVISLPIEESNEAQNFNGNHSSDESDDENLNKSIKKTKKSARVLSSDDENANTDDESHVNQKDTPHSDTEPMEQQQPTVSVRPSICDSDTKSSDNGNKSDEEIQPQKNVKKIKKKKNKLHKRLLATGNDSDSESNDEMTERPDKKQKKPKKSSKRKSDQSSNSGSSKSGSGSNSGSASDSDSKSDSNSSTRSNDQSNIESTVKPREKTAQRMSAKMAEHQMKEIQSESQRLARQMHVSIPYHKPKQHSLKEFLSRRSIIEHQEKVNSKPMPKAAVAIKMSGDELIQFMEHMNKRAKEAEEFFQDEEEEPDVHEAKSDESDDQDWSDKSEKKKPTETSEEMPEIVTNENKESETIMDMDMDMDIPEMAEKNDDAKINDEVMDQCSEVIQQEKEVELSEKNSTETNEPKESTLKDTKSKIEFHTERTRLDDELDAMIAKEGRAEKLKLCFPTDCVPKLKGDSGFVIDLETNDLKPIPKSGIDELLNRFIKNACVKTTSAEQQDVGIFHTDTGTVERHKFHVNLDEKPKKEPKPGESMFKLRSELSQKIKENREKQIAQRLQEAKQLKQLDSEEEEELGEEEQETEMCEEEQETEIPNETEQLMNLEATEEEQSEQNDDIDPSDAESASDCENSNDENQSDDEAAVDLDVTEASKRRRILIMDDSDDENNEPSPINAMTTESGSNEPVSQQPDTKSANQSFDDTSKAMTSHDLSALESEILQLDSQINAELNKSETTKLFQDNHNEYGDISESQLMELCSGSFVTQHPDKANVQPVQNESTEQIATQIEISKEASQSKPSFMSSDEEETEKNESKKVKKKQKKQKKQTLVYSDDEDDPATMTEEQEEEGEEEEEQIEDEEEDIGERYIEYDSDENEIEVELKKSDVKKKASEYLENEAELSESEWGSGDEDEKDEMNHYEAELGDLEQFDKNKLRDELERTRLREQIDDDARALRILKERFIEEEDNGMERERKFRWKHLNNGENDDQVQNADQDATGEQNNSDDENEAEWRRIRYEREQLLKQQTNDIDAAVERTTIALEVVEQKSIGNATSIFNNSRRISIIKPINNASSKTSSPFLITKSDLSMSHLSRKSFLNRDSPILEKLASLSKTGTDGEAILNTAKGKGNYVFVATEKKDTKRKSEIENGAMEPGATNPSKKSKFDPQKTTILRPQTKAFFESLK